MNTDWYIQHKDGTKEDVSVVVYHTKSTTPIDYRDSFISRNRKAFEMPKKRFDRMESLLAVSNSKKIKVKNDTGELINYIDTDKGRKELADLRNEFEKSRKEFKMLSEHANCYERASVALEKIEIDFGISDELAFVDRGPHVKDFENRFIYVKHKYLKKKK